MDRNFACFWPPNFFGGEPPEFWKLDYKIGPVSDHVAKFHGDRLKDLRDYALEKKKHHEHFISPPVTPYGRPNKAGMGYGEGACPFPVISYYFTINFDILQ